MMGRFAKAYAVDVNLYHASEEGAHSPSGPNGLIIIIIIITIIITIIIGVIDHHRHHM